MTKTFLPSLEEGGKREQKLTVCANRVGTAMGVPFGHGPGDGGSLFLSLPEPLDTERRRYRCGGPEEGEKSES